MQKDYLNMRYKAQGLPHYLHLAATSLIALDLAYLTSLRKEPAWVGSSLWRHKFCDCGRWPVTCYMTRCEFSAPDRTRQTTVRVDMQQGDLGRDDMLLDMS